MNTDLLMLNFLHTNEAMVKTLQLKGGYKLSSFSLSLVLVFLLRAIIFISQILGNAERSRADHSFSKSLYFLRGSQKTKLKLA